MASNALYPTPEGRRIHAPQPTSQELKTLGLLFVAHCGKVENTNEEESLRRAVVQFMHDDLLVPGERPERFTPGDVCEGIGQQADARNIDRTRTLKTRLKQQLIKFFSTGEGAKQKWCLYLDDKDYRLRVRLNTPEAKPTDYLSQFWAPHRESKNPTCILYPEPCFFTDSQRTYLRSPGVNHPDQREQFAYLTSDWSQLKTTYSYVPSGAVTAMLRLMALFRQWGQDLDAKPFLPQDQLPTAPNLIVLGTSTSLQAVATLERQLPIFTGQKHVTVRGADPRIDREYEEQDALMYQKWATLTRRWHLSRDRIVTLISAHHGRAIDAVAQFICEGANMPLLAEKLQKPQVLPPSFQAVFSVSMEETPRGPHTTETAVDFALDIRDCLH